MSHFILTCHDVTCRRLQRHTSRDQGNRLRDSQSLWQVAAIILEHDKVRQCLVDNLCVSIDLLVEVCSELLAVVAATHQVTLAAPVTIISSSIQRPVTVTLAWDWPIV